MTKWYFGSPAKATVGWRHGMELQRLIGLQLQLGGGSLLDTGKPVLTKQISRKLSSLKIPAPRVLLLHKILTSFLCVWGSFHLSRLKGNYESQKPKKATAERHFSLFPMVLSHYPVWGKRDDSLGKGSRICQPPWLCPLASPPRCRAAARIHREGRFIRSKSGTRKQVSNVDAFFIARG